VNLFKVLHAAVTLAGAPAAGRHVILSERSNFPTDLYIAESVAHATGLTLRTGDANELEQHFDDRLAVLLLTHVNYRDGRMHDMARVTRTAHEAGALVVWDLAHSAGAVPVDLMGADADFAVGCGYKYLNGGPGAPAFLWAHPRHTERMDRQLGRQPLTGWFGHAEPFRFETGYRAAAGIAQFACGTPPILSLAALDCGVSLFGHVEPVGGMPALRRKSVALTNHFMAGIDRFGAGLGLSVVTPREANDRGSQVSVGHPHAQQVMQSLIERGVVGDYRAGAALGESGVMRFGFTPLYTRFVDVWDALDHLREVLHGEVWTAPRFQRSAAVT
jgi:kynureninase